MCAPWCLGLSWVMIGVIILGERARSLARSLARSHTWRLVLARSWDLSRGYPLELHTGLLQVAAWTSLTAGSWVSRASIPREPSRSCITLSNTASDSVPTAGVANSPRAKRPHSPHLSSGGESRSRGRKSTGRRVSSWPDLEISLPS